MKNTYDIKVITNKVSLSVDGNAFQDLAYHAIRTNEYGRTEIHSCNSREDAEKTIKEMKEYQLKALNS